MVIKYLASKKEFEVYLITFDKILFDKEDIYKNTKQIILGNKYLNYIVQEIRNLKLDKLYFVKLEWIIT